MSDLEFILKKCEEILPITFNVKNIAEVKNFFKEVAILQYEDFVSQLVFEIYYNIYRNNASHTSIMQVYKKYVACDERGISKGYANDKEYKKIIRDFREFRLFNDNHARKHGIQQDIQFVDIKGINSKMEGQKVYSYQVNQLLDINEFEIFKALKENKISSSKRLADHNLLTMLRAFEGVYERIEQTYDTYLERSVQFHQLEICCRIETNYLLAKTLSEDSRSLQEKKNDFMYLSFFHVASNGKNIYQNKFIKGLDTYIQKYKENPLFIQNLIPIEIYKLNEIKYIIRMLVVHELKDKNIDLYAPDSEELFKNFIGLRQHACKEKRWEDIKLKNFRDLYKKN